ncbi:MAG: hypothetical protein H6682_02200 [Candidatus Eisenbacteria bacterium]|nr:hypothetical protein [Candidatus Eisenbacteria bacterium]
MRTSTDRIVTVLALASFLLASTGSELLAASLWIGTSDVSRPVWVDDDYKGLAPVLVSGLSAGPHLVEVGNRSGGSEWVRPWSTRVTLTASDDEVIRLSIPPLQVLRILSTGRSVEVGIDGDPVGWTPLHVLIPRDRALEVQPGAATPLHYRAQSASDSTLFVEAPREPRRAPASYGSSHTGWLLPLGAVACGVVGAWARQQGDQAYESYLSTVDREQMQDEFDRASNYDDVAVGFWVAAEVLLAASVWKWLRGDDVDVRSGQGHVGPGPFQLGADPGGELRVGVSLPMPWSGGGTTQTDESAEGEAR